MRLAIAALLCGALMACGEGTSADGPDDEVIDQLRLTDVASAQPANYVVDDHWDAFNGAGNLLELTDTAGVYIPRGIRWSLDSLPASSQLVNPFTGTIDLEPGFSGRLYLFAPTARSSREVMGFHFVAIAP